jgi:hypothetical protein
MPTLTPPKDAAKLFAKLAAESPELVNELRETLLTENLPQLSNEAVRLALIAVLIRAGLTTREKFEALVKEALPLLTSQVEALFTSDPEKAIADSTHALDRWYAAHERAAASREVPG